MILRQLFDEATWTYTYLVADEVSCEAAIIDPVKGLVERDLSFVSELGLTLKYSLDTHVHADHITGNGSLRERTGCQTGLASVNEVGCADIDLHEGDQLLLGRHTIKVIATPGHTNGCVSFLMADHVFTGDALFIRGCGRTDFQQGDAGKLYDSVTQKLFSLPEATWVHPGHDYHGRTLSTIAEEKAHNPRLRLDRAAFIAYMNALDLPNPKKIMEAVPANHACGMIL